MKYFKRSFVPLLVAACFTSAAAAPTLPQVVAGQATFSQQGNVFSITNTPDTIINWQSFSVKQGEVTRFIQQSSDSAVLNRILGQDPSSILGALQSNGKVFLINPNGILFGRDARVDVNGLTASTLNLSNADFLAGKKNFTAGAGAGSISNQGAITTPSGGQVFLVATNVENSGIITAPQGEVVLAAGHSVQLVDSGDPDLHVVVAAPDSRAINLGQLMAQGGKVGIYAALVNQRGVVNANSAQVGRNGKIVLKASGDTLLEQDSVTSATGAGQGGVIHLLGKGVSLGGNAQVDASGATGGGTVLVGGDYQGKNALLPNAQQTLLGKDAVIRADAQALGDGGKVVLWSDASTRAFGRISARGGALSGNGGLVETSGHYLDIAGVRVNASAARGKSGTWLIDPEDIEIVADGTGLLGDVLGGLTRISAATLTAPGTDIVLQAVNDLTINDAINTPYSVTAQAGRDITVNATVASSGGDLSFEAGRSFTLGTTGSLEGSGLIRIRADKPYLHGHIGPSMGALPVLSISSYDPGRQIKVRSSESESVSWLNPDDFARFEVSEIRIGDSAHTGRIEVSSRFAHSANVTIENAGPVSIKAPIDLSSNPHSRFVALLSGEGENSYIEIDNDGALIAGRSVLLRSDHMSIGGPIRAPAVTLTPHRAATAITLGGGADESGGLHIGQSELTHIRAAELTIGGLPDQFGQLRVGGLIDLDEDDHAPARLILAAGAGKFTADAMLDGGDGAVHIQASGIGGNGIIRARSVTLRSRDGIGAAGAPLRTRTAQLLAYNEQAGSRPINISNEGELVLAGAVQANAGGGINSGAINIDSSGGMTVPVPADSDAPSWTSGGYGHVRSSSGDINLTTHSPMTIAGQLATDSGNIRLEAGNGGRFTTLSGARVASGSGHVTVIAGSTDIADNTMFVASPDKLHLPGMQVPGAEIPAGAPAAGDAPRATPDATEPPPLIVQPPVVVTPPVLEQPPGAVTPPPASACMVTPAAAGCGEVLQPSFQACLSKPNDASCVGILPTISQCVANRGQAGCDVVLPTLQQCSSSPALQGCAAILPTLAQCAVSPSQPGCSAVLPTLAYCNANPSDPSCLAFNPAPGAGRDSAQGGAVAQAVQTSVSLINTGTSPAAAAEKGASHQAAAKPDEKPAAPTASENSGAKNEKPAKKMYCN